MAGMDRDQLRALVSQEIAETHGFLGGLLSDQRRLAMRYYLAKPYGNEQEDRSQVVTTEVRDIVETALPHLVNLFVASDQVVRFDPVGPGDEAVAQQATDYVNFVFMKDNPGFLTLYTLFKDALLQKNGIVKHYWEVRDRLREEEYSGLTEDELAALVTDDGVTVLEHGATPAPGAAPGLPPPLLHDVRIRRATREGRVRVEPVPPEEFGISRRARDLASSPLTYHRVRRTVSQLIEEGYDRVLVEALPSDDIQDLNPEAVERRSAADDVGVSQAQAVDPSMREVWIYECYVRTDYDGDGRAELRKVVCAGAGYEILENEVWPDDVPPFSSLTPIILPHQFHGLSLADLVMDLQLIRSTVMRQTLDNMYLINNARVELPEPAIGDNTIDDLLAQRPGGIVRTKAGGMMHMMEVQSIAPVATPILEMLEGEKQNRTGIVPLRQQLDPDVLQGTATGQQLADRAATMRLELIARIFAETGLKDMFRAILRLVCRHQDVPRMVRLRDRWVPMDPRCWNPDLDCAVSVGLGTGNRQQNLSHLATILSIQQQALAAGGLGLVAPKQLYNTLARIVENAGLKSVDPYFTDPDMHPPMPVPPRSDPEMEKVRMQMAIEQAKLQAAIERERMQAEADRQQKGHQLELDQVRARLERELEMLKIEAGLRLQRERLEAERALKLIELEMRYGRGPGVAADDAPAPAPAPAESAP